MSRRKIQDDGGSLELLLDTICNTFGGILFISLLVVILLNTTSSKVSSSAPQQKSQLELVESELKRQELANELERLQIAVGQMEVSTQSIVTPDIVDLANKLQKAENKYAQAVAENSKTQGRLNQTQIEINQIVIDAEQREERTEAARKKAAALEERLKESIAQRSGEAVIPKVQQSDLQPVIFVLRYGSLFGPWPSSDLKGTDVGGGSTRVDVAQGAGLSIDPAGETTAIKGKFKSNVSAGRHRAVICIWPDSYEQWTIVRRSLSELQMKYQLFPLEADGVLILGEGGGDSTVQG